MAHTASEFQPLNIAVLTVSDTRSIETDTSGQLLVDGAISAGHLIADRQLHPDDIYQIRAVVSGWIACPDVQVILVTGGTGFTGRDSTPEAVGPLLDKTVDGFGELFRHLSWEEIGAASWDYLFYSGYVTLAYWWARSAAAARAGSQTEQFKQAKLETARFYFARILPRTHAHKAAIESGAAPLMTLDAESFDP